MILLSVSRKVFLWKMGISWSLLIGCKFILGYRCGFMWVVFGCLGHSVGLLLGFLVSWNLGGCCCQCMRMSWIFSSILQFFKLDLVYLVLSIARQIEPMTQIDYMNCQIGSTCLSRYRRII